MFFQVRPTAALLADSNEQLIVTYRAVRGDVENLIDRLSALRVDRTTFLDVRRRKPQTELDVAARFIYLNRTAFNGLYRVNARGDFNVPFGCKATTRSVDPPTLRACSAALTHADLQWADFKATLDACEQGDFVYLDPPYTVKHNNNGFLRYNERLFSWEDQLALASTACDLVERGVSVVVSNADNVDVRKLYSRTMFVHRRVARLSRMAASNSHRGEIREILMIARPH